MSPQQSSSGNNVSPSDNVPQSSNDNAKSGSGGARKSDYRLIRDGGFRDMNHFMQSYNLKIHDHDDYQEAKQILAGFRKLDEEEAQQAEASKGSGKSGK
jgi:hypothetical protein